MPVLVLGESEEVRVRREQLASVAMGAALQRLRDGEAPLPLTRGQATAQAIRLRRQGMTLRHIEIVMRTYHGVDLSYRTWQRDMLRNDVRLRPDALLNLGKEPACPVES